MIPLQKIQKLPQSLRLRKAASIFGGAEHRLIILGKLDGEEAAYLCSLVRLLLDTEEFPAAAAEALKKADYVFSDAACTAGRSDNYAVNRIDAKEIRRSLNTVYHILLSKTGRNSADWDLINSDGALDKAKRRFFPGMQVYLEDIRSPFNVGSMFRAAESFGTEKIWLSPLCADPRHKRAERTALGCVDILPWERFPLDPFTAQNNNKTSTEFSEGPFFALETGGTALPDFQFPLEGIIITGSEELGVSPGALAAADESLGRVSIPSYGAKGSLNVSVAFGIVMQAWAAALNSRL